MVLVLAFLDARSDPVLSFFFFFYVYGTVHR